MAPLLPSYEHQTDGSVHAVFEGRVIAKAADFDSAVDGATEYLDSLKTKRDSDAKAEKESRATHIVTPNGLKGQIISRVDGMWGNEITVRFENNEIRRFETTAGLQFSTEQHTSAVPNNIPESLQTMLDRSVEPTRNGMNVRAATLENVLLEVHNHFAAERSPALQREYNRIAIAAKAELGEVKDVLAHLDAVDAENASPAAPVYAAVEQASMGRSDDWLQVTADKMIEESEAEDMEELLEEGPTKLVSSLADSAIHHQGTVAEIAANHVMGKTAGFQGPEVEAFREAFVAAAEQARRKELTYRKDAAHQEATQKQASIEDIPDEALFS